MREGFDELRALNERLRHLLDNPQYGLTTWRLMLSDVIYNIAQYGGRDVILGQPVPPWPELFRRDDEA